MPHLIQNFEQLATSSLRKMALQIAEAGFAAISTPKVITNNVSYDAKSEVLRVKGEEFNLKEFENIICVGFGKVALEAVTEIQNILDGKITCGFVIDLKDGLLENIVCRVGTHPHPTEVNVKATQELVSMLSGLTKQDLVIVVVGGGGSSLLCYPHDLSCQSQTELVKTLMNKGAAISEINTVRKHVSKVKGGNLAKICYPATVVGLIFSDVPGDDLGMVASGPTVKDNTTAADAADVLKKYDVLETCQLPTCRLYETPKENMFFEKVHNFLMVSSHTAVAAMKEKAEELGWKTNIFSENFQGEAKVLGPQVVKLNQPGECLLGAGESTVKVMGHGQGGRNQEMALAALSSITKNQVFLPLTSDGYDNTEFAGAIVDETSKLRAQNLHLDPKVYLQDNDSYHFFQALDEAVFTGLTSSNVADFFIALKQ